MYCRLPLRFGDFRALVFENEITKEQHLALVKGEIDPERPLLVRVHSSCLTGDVFGSFRCDCGEQLKKALRLIAEEGEGVLLYLHQEGRGIGLVNKLRAYALQDAGRDTVQANEELGFKPDLRDYGIGAQILSDCGVRQMNVLMETPRLLVLNKPANVSVLGDRSGGSPGLRLQSMCETAFAWRVLADELFAMR